MKIVKGIKVGGLKQKIFGLTLIIIVALIGAYAAVSVSQQRSLTRVVRQANADQQESIAAVSEETMKSVLDSTMAKSTDLQAYIADDLFREVRSDVLMLQALATELFEHPQYHNPHPYAAPSAENDGIPSVQLIHEHGVDPEDSALLGLAANLGEVMLTMYQNSDNVSGCFIGLADGNLLFVNDRSGSYVTADGTPLPLDVRSRPWYVAAAEAGELIFTGVEVDAYTGSPTLECAAPVYRDGQLVAVVGTDIYLTAIDDYVAGTSAYGGFLCVISENGQVIFSPEKQGPFQAEFSAGAPDLRQSENETLARFVREALEGKTGLETIIIDEDEYYMTGAPMPSVGWTVISVVDKAVTRRPTDAMLERYAAINEGAMETFTKNAEASTRILVTLTLVILLLACASALTLAGHIVKPVEHMTKRINALRDGDSVFEMEDAYRTGDEIEVLAESFTTLSKRTRDYITQITAITAEKERIGTEMSLATRIQADMLPNIYPAFPDRREFDVYASMDPAKEVGGDFYDFFLIDDDHLGVVIADVSGKGVPAALFMMISKILVQNSAKAGRSPAEALRSVNEQICANNREGMFVTVWLGILDIKTGEITAVNAGHEYPALMGPDGRFELVKDKHSFVIGGMEDVRYREYTLTMKPGTKLFLYTDGVPEATNAEKELFGTERMLAALNEDTAAAPQEMLKNVRRAVDGFVKDAEQFDDLTMLVLEYKGDAPSAPGPEAP